MIRTVFVAGLAALVAAPTSATTFVFSEGGFAEGASISGYFVGDDVDGDGILSSFDGEVTDFSVSFSGNSHIGAFTLGYADLIGLVYHLDGTIGDGDFLGNDTEGMLAANANYAVDTGPGPSGYLCDGSYYCSFLFDAGNDPVDASYDIVLVQAVVPEPSSWMMLTAGFGIAGAAVRRNRKIMVRFA